MLYAYIRVSTQHQSLQRQKENILKAYPTCKIFEEKYTGTAIDRPVWNKLIKAVKAGDTIVFDSVSRMSRSAEEGFKAYQKLFHEGINLVFLKEPHINTEVYKQALQTAIPMTGSSVDCILEGINQYLMILAEQQIKIAFEQSEKEVNDLHNRIKEGMAVSNAGSKIAKARTGKKYETKKSTLAKEIILKHSKSFNGSLSDTEVITLCGISRNSYYRYKKELLENG